VEKYETFQFYNCPERAVITNTGRRPVMKNPTSYPALKGRNQTSINKYRLIPEIKEFVYLSHNFFLNDYILIRKIMPQSLTKIYIHIVFSTKNRQHLITDDIQNELFDYLGGICKQLECNPVRVGGYKNHVHILCILSKKITLIKLIEEIKKSSSKWIKTKGQEFSKFYWQDGYSAFSVNPSQIDIVTKYINNQEEHHRKKSFEEECRTFFKKYGVEYDEKYVWD
jgi:putative transposase